MAKKAVKKQVVKERGISIEPTTQGKKRRRFLGKTEGFLNNEEKLFEKAHLKAYLKGKKRFNHGFEKGRDLRGNLIPTTHPVKQEFYYE